MIDKQDRNLLVDEVDLLAALDTLDEVAPQVQQAVGTSACLPHWIYISRFIKPVDYADNHLFIDGRDNDTVKRRGPDDHSIEHPDAWLRPLRDMDDSCEELIQEIVREAEKIKPQNR